MAGMIIMNDKNSSAGRKETPKEVTDAKIASIKIDFDTNNVLPGLNKKQLEILGVSDRPVLLKKTVTDKNRINHPDVKNSDYAKILGSTLYRPDGVIRASADNPYFNFLKKFGPDKHSVVLLDVDETKANIEIVNIHWLSKRARQQKERKAKKFLQH
jgi:hypothetical protein